MVLFKAATLDRQSQSELNEFNKILSAYQAIFDPEVKQKRDTLKDKFEDMKDLFSNSFSARATEPQ